MALVASGNQGLCQRESAPQSMVAFRRSASTLKPMPAIDRGLKGHALRALVQPIGRGLRSGANRGLAFVKEFALAHWVVGGADDRRLFVRVVHGG